MMIKTKADLLKIKQQQTPLLKMREGKKRYRIVVALGDNPEAKETLNAFIQLLDEQQIYDCAVFFGPKHAASDLTVEIHGKQSHTYVDVTTDKVKAIIDAHIIKDTPLLAYLYKGDK